MIFAFSKLMRASAQSFAILTERNGPKEEGPAGDEAKMAKRDASITTEVSTRKSLREA
jgi:hypothetical protein